MKKTEKGSALLLALCAIAILGMAVLGLSEFANLGLDEEAEKEKNLHALQLAESGLALGLNPLVAKLDPILSQKLSSTESFEVHFKSEGGRMNINTMLQGGREQKLSQLFENWGVGTEERSVVIDCLMDWIDSDLMKREHGAEEAEYESLGLVGYPPNRAFQTVDEMEKVIGMDAVAKVKPDWKDYFTVWNDGKLDLNEAPADLIEAMCGVGAVPAEEFVRRRLGADGLPDTDDDVLYTSMTEVRTALGLSETEFAAIENLVTLNSNYRRIESVGKTGSHERKLTVVVRRNQNPVQYQAWIEQ